MSSYNQFTNSDGLKIRSDTDSENALKKLQGSGAARLRSSESRRRNLQTYSEAYTNSDVNVVLGDFDTASVKQKPGETPVVRIPSTRYKQLATDYERETFDQKIQYAMTVHELGHILYTPSDYVHEKVTSLPKRQQSAAKTIWNALEDGAIEEQLRHDLGENIAKRLATLHANLSKSQLNRANFPLTYRVLPGIKIACLDLARHDSGILRGLRDDNDERFKWDDTEQETLFEDFFSQIEKVVQDVLTTSDPHARTDRIFEFWDEIVDYLDINDREDEVNNPKEGDQAQNSQSQQDGDQGSMGNRGMPDDTETSGSENQTQEADDLGDNTDKDDVRKRIQSVTKEQPQTSPDDDSTNSSAGNQASEDEPQDDTTADNDESVGNSNDDQDNIDENDEGADNSNDHDNTDETSDAVSGAAPDVDSDISGNDNSDESSNGNNSEESNEEESVNDDNDGSNATNTSEDNTTGKTEQTQKTLGDFDSTPESDSSAADNGASTDGNSSVEDDETADTEPKDGTSEGSPTKDENESDTDSTNQEENSDESDEKKSPSPHDDPSSTPENDSQSDGDNKEIADSKTDSEDTDDQPQSTGQESTNKRESDDNTDKDNNSIESDTDGSEDNSGQSTDDSSSDDLTPDSNAPPGTGKDELETSEETSDSLDKQLKQEQQEVENEDQPLEEAFRAFSDILDSIDGGNSTVASTNAAGDTTIDSLEFRPEPEKPFQPDIWNDAEDQSVNTARLLERYLKREERDDHRRGVPTGTVDGSQLFGVEAGDLNIMQQRHPGKKKNYHVMIVLDRSHSMRNDTIEIAERAVVEFALGLERLGISIAIMDMYNDTARLISPFDVDTERSKKSLINRDTNGGTPLDDALAIGRQRLEMKGGSTFMLMVTDGKPGDEESYIDELENSHMPVLGINLALDERYTEAVGRLKDQQRFYDANAIVTDGQNLEVELENLICDIAF